jgi:hypothetical protein
MNVEIDSKKMFQISHQKKYCILRASKKIDHVIHQ